MERLALSITLTFLVMLGVVASSQSEIVDRVVAVVNGEAITLSMVEDTMNSIWTDPQNMPGSQQDALQRLINHKLKLQEARRLGVIVSEESLSSELTKVASRFNSPEDVSEALRRQGITQEDMEERLIEKIMVQEMVNRKFRLFLEVTDLEAADFFQQNKDKFLAIESVNLSQIFFRLAPNSGKAQKEIVSGKAEAVLKELKGGASFLKYIGEEGVYVAVDQSIMLLKILPPSIQIDVVAAAIPLLEFGEISDLIETPDGYFIVKLNHREAMRQASFADVKKEIEASLLKQKTEAELVTWLEKQREMADIRIK